MYLTLQPMSLKAVMDNCKYMHGSGQNSRTDIMSNHTTRSSIPNIWQ